LILCFDGGGSKCRAILADDDLNLIGEGRSLGTNTNHTPLEEAASNIRDCLAQTTLNKPRPGVDTFYITMVGPIDILLDLIKPYSRKRQPSVHIMDEAHSGLWAGSLAPGGFVALSGTGSDVFHVSSDERRTAGLGGWGLLLGDEGSGAWIGQQAYRAVVRDMEGVGPHTKLTDAAQKFLDIGENDLWRIISLMYAAPSYVRFFGAFVPEAARAAREGDETALRLFREAGEHMARYFIQLYARASPAAAERFCVLSGGAWKAHPLMFDTFRQRLAADAPDINARWPYFEPVMAGVSRDLAFQHPNWSVSRRLEFLTQRYPGYRITR
jgi:N-acetylglucosamine kinase-like BadF-type ATPase